MIQLIPVSNSMGLNDDLKRIYINSFPPDERRDWQEMKELLHHSNFSLEPANDAALRRIAFYERLGFSVCEGIYCQPPYSADKNEVKMLLMSFPERILTLELTEIKTQIYREVYQQNDPENFHE